MEKSLHVAEGVLKKRGFFTCFVMKIKEVSNEQDK